MSARAEALELLDHVLRRRRPLDECLEASPGLARLDARDRAFARTLVATTLRRLGEIDHLIGRCLERSLPAKASRVRDILRLGACQLLFLGTPPHAAVDTAVAMAANIGFGPLKSLVNAVLRRLGREGPAWREEGDAARLDTPGWLWQAWSEAYGEPTARAIAEAHLHEAPLDITTKADIETWAGRLGAARLPTGSLRRPGGGLVTGLPGYDEGAWWVQDAAAALPARLLGEVAGMAIADLCAAPGGKTAQLAAAGARVTAVERSETRARRLVSNLERLGLVAEVVVADAAKWQPASPVDAVLLDAPCTATGTIRRHPDVAWLKRPEDVPALASVQERQLAAAIAMTRPGGRIVYCACSLQSEEGPDVVAAVLRGGAPAARLPLLPGEAGIEPAWITARGELRTLPCHLAGDGGMDGFFATRMVRR